ncbi:AIPR family protein [Clostridium baratii]|uniref:AIPR family protein n=1 Tax=Clostridium baratii TaxID=1561 RepID=UPI001C02D015|nr:AIPR family protein [Clostridium baratii]
MNHLKKFKTETNFITKYGIGNAHLLWVMGLYLDFYDLEQLEKESLTDESNDKKIDFIRCDIDLKRITLCQGYYSEKMDGKEIAPANKASDLNTAIAWLLNGEIETVPEKLKIIISECREAINNKEIDRIDILYVHNCAESRQVESELNTVRANLESRLTDITIISKELGIEAIEKLYLAQKQSLIILDEIECPGNYGMLEVGYNWRSVVLTISGEWLYEQFNKYEDDLFSTNYRGFLGITKTRKINNGIKRTAESKGDNFLVYNNGITILTNKFETVQHKGLNKGVILKGMSIINGAQTTGSIGQVKDKEKLKNVKVLCKIVETTDEQTIEEIVKYNNTQNVITTWDQYSNSAEQKRIKQEFKNLNHEYSFKRGFSNISSKLGIEQVAQPVLSLHGDFASSNTGKNNIFESKSLYNEVFQNSKARHLLFAYTLSKSIEDVYGKLKSKENLIPIEEQQLNILRNLKAKNFIIALVGEVIQTISDKKIDKKVVCFKYDYCNANKYELEYLIGKWNPLVTLVISFLAQRIISDFNKVIREDKVLDKLGGELQAFIYTMKSTGFSPALNELSEMIE